MKKQYLRILIVLVICALLTGGFPLTAAAATETAELFTLDSTQNMGITVKYETEAPAVEFIAPDGTIYGAQAIANGKMTVTDSGTALFFRIPNAQPGTWQIRYDKKSNTNIEVAYAPYVTALNIDQFSFNKVSDNTLDVQFLVSHDKRIGYDYSIYAIVMENGVVAGQKLLMQGYGNTNAQQQTVVYLDSLATHSNYKLILEVNARENDMPVFDSMISEATFDYTDPNAEIAPEGFHVEIDTAGSLLIKWENTAAAFRKALVAVYLNDGAEPAYYNTFESHITSTEIALDMATTKNVRIDLSYKDYSDKPSQIASRSIDMSLASKVIVKCEDISAAAQAEIIYQLDRLPGAPFPAVLTVNGVAQELSLKGNNSFSVKLEAFRNTLELLWRYDEYTTFRIEKDIYSDRLAPSLNIPDVTNKVLTDQSSYILTGSVDPGCTVTVNGTEIAVDNNGIFTSELSLKAGENVFTVIAVGPNGNRTQRSITVQWVESGVIGASGLIARLLKYVPLAACALLSIILSIFVIRSRKKYQAVQSEKGTRAAVFAIVNSSCALLVVLASLVTAALAAFWLYLLIRSNSAGFYDIVVADGVNQAYELLQTRDKYMWSAIISAGCLAVTIGLRILFKKLSKKAPKAKNNDQ